jgi:hypothetical protein
VAYDRADWHYGGDFPAGLPDENGGTHIGMFLAWAIQRGLEGEEHREDSSELLESVRHRKMTGRDFLFEACDGKFWDSDLNDEGNAFAGEYYENEQYFKDYEKEFVRRGTPTIYHVADTWKNFDRICKVLDRRFCEWKSGSKKQARVPAQPARGRDVLDAATGTLRFEKPAAGIGGETPREEFLAGPLGKNAEIFIRNEPHCSWRRAKAAIGGMNVIAIFAFTDARLNTITLVHDSTEYKAWDEASELKRKKVHDAWLKKILGSSRKFSWGTVDSFYDARSVCGSIMIRFNR